MEIVKAFNCNKLHTEIVIKGTNNDPLFRASDIGEVLEISNIRTTINNFDDSEKRIEIISTQGGRQNVTFLTEKGLYKVLFKSRKQIAEIFQNWVCDVIKELRLTGLYSLQQELEKKTNQVTTIEQQQKKEYEEKLKTQKQLDRQQILLREFGNIGSLVYIIKVKTYENGEYIIKIGESRRGVEARFNEHRTHFGKDILLLDCFIVNRSKDFENFLHCQEIIKRNNVKNLSGHESEKELFLIGNHLTYSMVLDIINKNIRFFNDNNDNMIEKLKLENEQLRLISELKESTPFFIDLVNTHKKILEKLELLESHTKSIEILEKSNQSQIKITTNFGEPLVTLGPRLQKINSETMQFVRVYESVAECMKENYKLKRPSINKAIQENTIYEGFRWSFVDRELDPTIIHTELEPTKQTRIQNLDYIAKLNEEKTEILNVYLDRKTAALQNEYSMSGLDIAVQKQSLTKNHYYLTYSKCDENLKQNFEEKHGKPILYKNGIGQYDLNNKLVKEFVCKYDCIRLLKISDKTLTKALDNDIPYNNYYFRKLLPKVYCL